MDDRPEPQPILPITRAVDVIVIVLVLIAGFQLFILAEETDRYFAWTIGVPLPAAFLGAGYWAALVSSVFLLTLRFWVQGRSTLVTAFTSTSLLCLATFLHLKVFHLDSATFSSWLAAWVWVIVYVAVPPTLILLFALQSRLPGRNPPRARNVPPWVMGWMMLQAVTGFAIGIALVTARTGVMNAWPWTLTILTARTTRAWLCALGMGALMVVLEKDLSRVTGTLLGLIAFAVLQLIAVARYANAVDWNLAALLYVLFLVGLFVVTGSSLMLSRAPGGLLGRAGYLLKAGANAGRDRD